MSYVEPTAFAVLALFNQTGAGGQDVPEKRYQAVQKALTWLRAQQHSDGSWGIMRDDPGASWMTYPVIWMLNVLVKIPELVSYYGKPEDKDMLDRGRRWIMGSGREPSVDDEVNAQVQRLFRIDSSYLGWSWGPGEAGWVIPTALAVIALVVEDPATMPLTKEISNAKNYLRDRACPQGGWNVGNPYMLGKVLPPTPDATSFALVAWRITLTASDFGPNITAVDKGVAYLENYIMESNSDHTVALCAWALSLFKEATEVEKYRLRLVRGLTSGDRVFQYKGQQVTKRTLNGQNRTTGDWADSAYTTAIALLALSDNRYYLNPK
ncbi:MAG: hypothetical protein JWP00_946 [Chloroflexi bacterium]|nr:hypothetical protein [Chloroflexota bacterium]